jgi:phosphoribosylformimino-5-aminoimidazole carboxamide ribotide isomerase
MLAAGIDRVVIGTWATRGPEAVAALIARHADRIAIGIDARNGMVAAEGWTETTNLPAQEFAAHWAQAGAGTIIATDIATDGMLTGPNTAFLSAIARSAPSAHLIASGGVSTCDDLRALRDLAEPNLRGVIVGRAIYAGRFTVREALAALA